MRKAEFANKAKICRFLMAFVLIAGYGFAADIDKSTDSISSLNLGSIKSIHKHKLKLDGFGGPMLCLSPVKGNLGILFGGRGSGNITDHFTLGGGGCGTLNSIPVSNISMSSNTYRMTMGYGGVELGYVFNPMSPLNVSMNMLFGGGMVIRRDDAAGSKKDFYWFYTGEPAVYATLNIFQFLQLNMGIKYRQLVGLNTNWISNNDLSGAEGSLALLFGRKQSTTKELLGGAAKGE